MRVPGPAHATLTTVEFAVEEQHACRPSTLLSEPSEHAIDVGDGDAPPQSIRTQRSMSPPFTVVPIVEGPADPPSSCDHENQSTSPGASTAVAAPRGGRFDGLMVGSGNASAAT